MLLYTSLLNPILRLLCNHQNQFKPNRTTLKIWSFFVLRWPYFAIRSHYVSLQMWSQLYLSSSWLLGYKWILDLCYITVDLYQIWDLSIYMLISFGKTMINFVFCMYYCCRCARRQKSTHQGYDAAYFIQHLTFVKVKGQFLFLANWQNLHLKVFCSLFLRWVVSEIPSNKSD